MKRLWILAIPLALFVAMVCALRLQAQLVTPSGGGGGSGTVNTGTSGDVAGYTSNGTAVSDIGAASGQVGSLGVGVTADGTSGDIKANNEVIFPTSISVDTATYNIARTSQNGGGISITSGTGNFTFNNGGSSSPLLITAARAVYTGVAIQSTGGTLPTVTGGCGSGNVNAGSTNNRGSVTTGTTETTCTVVFSASGTWANAPFCLCADGGGDAAPLGCSTSGATTAHVVLTFASATGKTFNYMCM